MEYLKYFESKKDKFPDIKKEEKWGYHIKWGRDAKSNDYLTFIDSDEEDIWLHAKGVPGSHVVISIRNNLATDEIIQYAAGLAKKHSKAKKDEPITVVYCKRKFVKKLPGMNPGQVKVDSLNSQEITI